ncbi:hypothetical protein [Sporanaerobacter acetigenes]|uniref:hypothetical protein n=1 Tax=Sporanaerobacter acetigenes TaxID=165813 RepID=UPI00331CCE9A
MYQIIVQIIAAKTVVSNVISEIPPYAAVDLVFKTFLVMEFVTKTTIAQTNVTRMAIETPTVLISDNISAVSAGLLAAVKNGNHGTTSPCQICSYAKRKAPPHKRRANHISLVEKLIFVSGAVATPLVLILSSPLFFSLDLFTCATTVTIAASAAGTRKQAILNPPFKINIINNDYSEIIKVKKGINFLQKNLYLHDILNEYFILISE